jgi:hypothetical protein
MKIQGGYQPESGPTPQLPTTDSGVISSEKLAKEEIYRLRAALRHIADDKIIQGMSPAIFARHILEN